MLELLARARRMDTRAFFDEFYPRVYRFVWMLTGGGHADVEEIAQDVLLHAWRDREAFRAQSDPFAWVKSIARHRVLEYRRRQNRKGRAEAVLRAAARFDTELVPEDVLREGEFRARVWAALETIGKEAAALLVARYLQDRSVRAIAEERGETEKAVESRLQRARDAFREAMKSGDDDDEA